MKEKLINNGVWKLVSLLSAFLVWLLVVNAADPVMTDTVEIPIDIVNGEVLTDNGLTYEIIGKKTTTVSYEIHTSNAYRIKASDFRAYADLSELWSVTGAVPVKVEVVSNSGFLVSDPVSKTGAIKIETEPLQTKRFALETTLKGDPEDGYRIGTTRLSPDHLYLTGPESEIGKISSIGIEVSVDDLSADVSGVAVPRYYDANGNTIDLSNRIEVNADRISYTMQMLKEKEVALGFEAGGEAADGYRFTGIACDVNSITVAGIQSAVDALNKITVPAELLNVDGADESIVKTIDITALLPVGVTLADNSAKNIDVTLTVEKLEDEVFVVELDHGCLQGDDNETYIYRIQPDTVNVRIRALREELDALTIDTNDLQIDVEGRDEGLYHLAVDFVKELDPGYKLISIGTCTVNITRISGGPGEAAETPGTVEAAGTPETAAETTAASRPAA